MATLEKIRNVDQEAVVAPRSGDIAELYETYADEALRLAYLLTGDQDTAEDLVHDAFVKLVGRFRHRRGPGDFGAYLKRTVVNLARSCFRRRRVERAFLQREASTPRQAVASPRRHDDVLIAALMTLPKGCHRVALLRRLEPRGQSWPAVPAQAFST